MLDVRYVVPVGESSGHSYRRCVCVWEREFSNVFNTVWSVLECVRILACISLTLKTKNVSISSPFHRCLSDSGSCVEVNLFIYSCMNTRLCLFVAGWIHTHCPKVAFSLSRCSMFGSRNLYFCAPLIFRYVQRTPKQSDIKCYITALYANEMNWGWTPWQSTVLVNTLLNFSKKWGREAKLCTVDSNLQQVKEEGHLESTDFSQG